MTTSFTWDPASDQTYGENDGDQKNSDGDFGKAIGRNFAMSGGSLTLAATTPASWIWGRYDGFDGVTKDNYFAFTKNSSFSMFGGQVATLLFEAHAESFGSQLFINLADNAIFTLQGLANFAMIASGKVARFTLKDGSQCNFNSITTAELSFSLDINDGASFKVDIVESLQMANTSVNVNASLSETTDSPHFSLESKGTIAFFHNTNLSFKNKSEATIKADEMVFQECCTEITASDSAAVTLDINKINFVYDDDKPYFKLESGNPKILFTKLAAEDFLDKAPAGSLYFDTTNASASNHGRFVLNGCGSDSQFDKLISRNIVSIDGKTDQDYVRERLKKNNYEDFNLIIELAD